MSAMLGVVRILRHSAASGFADFATMFTWRTWSTAWLGRVIMQVMFFALIGLLSRNGYPGGPDECLRLDDCYCEAPRPGMAAQPANAWSNLGFVLVGLAVLADTSRRRSPGSPARMEADRRYPPPLRGGGHLPGHGLLRLPRVTNRLGRLSRRHRPFATASRT